MYPIHCPTTQCQFQYCMKCMESFIHSSNDGYTEASDGSYQVKVSIRCPMCRAPYRTPSQQHASVAIMAISSPSSTASNAIVYAILKLRQAASIHIPTTSTKHNTNYNTNDSDLSASQLAQRNQFLMNYQNNNNNSNNNSISNNSNNTTNIIPELKDAIATVQHYYDSIDCKDCGTVPSLPWDDWEQYIQTLQQQELQQQQIQLSNMSLSSQGSSNNKNTTFTSLSSETSTTLISRDPTLFMGLDELLTYDEQEFITHMFISGDAELLAQAAYLLHSIMCTMMIQQQTSTTSAKDSITNSATKPNTTTTTTKKQKTMAQLEHEQKIRKKFPVPQHMPRVVTIPPYNPLLTNSKQTLIKFIPTPPPSRRPPSTTTTAATTPSPLTLVGVNGIAGRVGLRRGDVITHVNQERVHTFGEYTIAVQYALEQQQQQECDVPQPPSPRHGLQSSSPSSSVMAITVNANDDIAQQLQVRAQQMQLQNVRFHG